MPSLPGDPSCRNENFLLHPAAPRLLKLLAPCVPVSPVQEALPSHPHPAQVRGEGGRGAGQAQVGEAQAQERAKEAGEFMF